MSSNGVAQPLPGNLGSIGFESDSVSEFGDEITFAHSQRRLKTVTVTMSSWGCQAGAWSAVKVGSKPYPDTLFWNTTAASFLCDTTPLPGAFNLDSPTSACWTGFVPAVQFRAGSSS
jgi:hypothetical protein